MVDFLRELWPAILIGFSIAAPVGPIGVLCIRRTLVDGRLHGLLSGLGAATADAVYGSLAVFGLTVVARVLVDQQLWLRLIGGAFLCFLGLRSLLSQVERAPGKCDEGLAVLTPDVGEVTPLSAAPASGQAGWSAAGAAPADAGGTAAASRDADGRSSSWVAASASAYFSTFLLTLTNPLTILSFAAIFAGLGVTAGRGAEAGLILVLGVFLGSAAWWLLLSQGVGFLRGYVTPGALRWINRISGIVVAGFGLVTLASLAFGAGR